MNLTQTHLAQMTGLCGDFPSELLDTGRRSKLYFNDQGQHRVLHVNVQFILFTY